MKLRWAKGMRDVVLLWPCAALSGLFNVKAIDCLSESNVEAIPAVVENKFRRALKKEAAKKRGVFICAL